MWKRKIDWMIVIHKNYLKFFFFQKFDRKVRKKVKKAKVKAYEKKVLNEKGGAQEKKTQTEVWTSPDGYVRLNSGGIYQYITQTSWFNLNFFFSVLSLCSLSLVFWRRVWICSKSALSTKETERGITWTGTTQSTSAGSCQPWWVWTCQHREKSTAWALRLHEPLSSSVFVYSEWKHEHHPCVLKHAAAWNEQLVLHIEKMQTRPLYHAMITVIITGTDSKEVTIKLPAGTLYSSLFYDANIYPLLLFSDQLWRWPWSAERELVRWLQRWCEPVFMDWKWRHLKAVGWVWLQPSKVRTVLGVCCCHVYRWLNIIIQLRHPSIKRLNHRLWLLYIPH